uniref:RING-type domain-containing protein n=1 Tax=Hanusia phi TaxID=3032 RepID=A0A7S0EIT8_9CRYP|mmetsp:Transcript_24417/g.55035  ORF Transcript_24417/g.55035 Transcript_24417/m.55035 type:complete len:336 (+) Transcript_24417:166-1173(+)
MRQRQDVAGDVEDARAADNASLLLSTRHRKSLFLAYLLLFVGGVFGLHWWYLGDSHKFQLYLRTLGLCFVGVFLDMWELPWIVAEINSRMTSDNDMAERESSGSLHSPGRNQENSSTTTSAREPTRAREQQRRTAAQGERATGRQRIGQSAELAYLQSLFSNIEPAEVSRIWSESRRDLTSAVEKLSAMSEAMQRTVKLVHSAVPTGIGNEANLDEEGVKECLICFGRGIDTVLLPCQHSGLCVACAESVLRRSPSLCPICRMEVYEVLRFVGEESVSLTIDDKEKCDVLVPRSSDADAANEEEPKPPPTRDSEGTAEVEAPTLEESPNEADGRG